MSAAAECTLTANDPPGPSTQHSHGLIATEARADIAARTGETHHKPLSMPHPIGLGARAEILSLEMKSTGAFGKTYAMICIAIYTMIHLRSPRLTPMT